MMDDHPPDDHPPDDHPPLDELLRFLESLPPEKRKQAYHALECPRCQTLLESLMDPPQDRPSPLTDLREYAASRARERFFRRLEAHLERKFHRLVAQTEKERAEARGLLREFLDQPPERRRLLLGNDRRFHTHSFLSLLLDESRKRAFHDPREGEALACRAFQVARRLEAAPYGKLLATDARGRIWILIAHARWHASDLPGAEKALQMARRDLAQGTGDPWDWARFHMMTALLLQSRRRFREAADLLRRAARAHEGVGEYRSAARALNSLAVTYREIGIPEKAIEALERALELLQGQAMDPRLELCLRHNLILNLCETGRVLEAQRLLDRTRALYRRFPEPYTQHRLRWVEGKLAHAQGHLKEAEAKFQEAREGFLRRRIPYDVALVSLDLSAVYLDQERREEIRRLAQEMLSLFQSLGISREATAALVLLRQAAAHGAMTRKPL